MNNKLEDLIKTIQKTKYKDFYIGYNQYDKYLYDLEISGEEIQKSCGGRCCQELSFYIYVEADTVEELIKKGIKEIKKII